MGLDNACDRPLQALVSLYIKAFDQFSLAWEQNSRKRLLAFISFANQIKTHSINATGVEQMALLPAIQFKQSTLKSVKSTQAKMDLSQNKQVSDNLQKQDLSEIRKWQQKIEIANRYNIFCHCRTCKAEWIASSLGVACEQCGSINVEYISCWQFPDD